MAHIRNKPTSMQRRHFELIASIVRSLSDTETPQMRETIARRFANELSATNPQFDHNRFLKACLS